MTLGVLWIPSAVSPLVSLSKTLNIPTRKKNNGQQPKTRAYTGTVQRVSDYPVLDGKEAAAAGIAPSHAQCHICRDVPPSRPCTASHLPPIAPTTVRVAG